MSPRRLPPTSLAGVALLALGLSASAGIPSDYDYPGQGDDWYGRSAATRPGRDYPAARLDQLASGDDFCRGYDPSFARFGLGPPLPRTSAGGPVYDFRFAPAAASWPCLPGTLPPACDDGDSCTAGVFDGVTLVCVQTVMPDGVPCPNGILCDGEEICMGGACLSGSPPSCDDGNSCTADFCESWGDFCFNLPPPPPPATENITATFDPSGPHTTFVWDPVYGLPFNLYRGSAGDISDLACLAPALKDPFYTDFREIPALGAAYYYLPVAVNCSGEGPLGDGENAPQFRQVVQPCNWIPPQ